ncbi:hypothetical protein P154DRAFT_318026 [Amniculicola lignicola CBS 123094]|uniref:C2H2-type domain-containing protein n=1 Tax=Amniculicola lignicola CBS 123094 TaxID=1392246 RepID=A0A6A5WVE8_9PLEO|nr:hypothetical protein P154DRAFT_318026 [Amniculicola lignicola CBS 123094]
MDSAYQSQSGASRRRAPLPEGYQPMGMSDGQTRMNNQFNELLSPALSSGTFGTFQDPGSDLGPMHLPGAAGQLDAEDSAFSFANHTSGQEYANFSTTMGSFAPTNSMAMGFYSHEDFSPSFNDSYMYTPGLQYIQDPATHMYNTPITAPAQRPTIRPLVDTHAIRPSSHRSTSSYTVGVDVPRRASAHEAGFNPFVMSPTSAVSAPTGASLADFEEVQFAETRYTKQETGSNSFTTQSLNGDEDLQSTSSALEAKNLEEEQCKIARNDPLYFKGPASDGKYHCPEEGKPGCTHKPTPLKCNYDKYVDSHLKPFRCKSENCTGVQFSSTACLLRHEREAHGLHGHGSRPHLCHFPDCERAMPGNGFPRRYNLFDHMKRVHDYTGPTTELSPPVTQAPSSNRRGTTRKRKSTTDATSERRVKAQRLSALQEQRNITRANLNQKFLNKKADIVKILSNLQGPEDLKDALQLSKEVMALQEISNEFKTVGG